MKNLVLVLLPLLVVPLIALGVLSWMLAGRTEDRLLAARRAQHVELAQAFEDEFGGAMHQLAGEFGQWAEQISDAAPAVAAPARGQLWTVVFADDGRGCRSRGEASVARTRRCPAGRPLPDGLGANVGACE